MWENFQQTGVIACGAVGVTASLAAVLTVASRPKAALRLAVAATVVGIACAAFAGFGQMHQRHETDRDLASEELRPAQRQRLRREGYLKARDGAATGLLVAAVPLLAGMILMFVAARRRAEAEAPERDPDIPFAPRPRLGVPVVTTLVGVLSAGFALGTLAERVPGGNPSAAETAVRVRGDVERVQKAGEHDDVLTACKRLEDDLDARDASVDPGLVPGLPAATRQCVEERIQQAVARQALHEIQERLAEVRRSYLVLREPALRRLVEATTDEVSRLSTAPAQVND
jgi:hypothetical protein